MRGCFFHLRQALHKAVRRFGLEHKYTNNEPFRRRVIQPSLPQKPFNFHAFWGIFFYFSSETLRPKPKILTFNKHPPKPKKRNHS